MAAGEEAKARGKVAAAASAAEPARNARRDVNECMEDVFPAMKWYDGFREHGVPRLLAQPNSPQLPQNSVPLATEFHNSAAIAQEECQNMTNQRDEDPALPPQKAAAPVRSVIIAGCGYSGLRAAREWLSAGARVFAVTRTAARAQQLAATGVQPLVLNLADSGVWPVLPDTDLVLWSVGFDRSGAHSREAVWLDGLQRFLERLPAGKNPRRILLTSSTSVYGDCGGGEVDERTVPQPEQEGGKVCLAAERLLQEFAAASGWTAVVLRLAGIYGPGRLLRRLEDLRAGVPIAAAADSWLNLVHVHDVVRSLQFCAEHPRPPETLNVAAEGTATRREYYETLAQLTGTPAPVFAEPAAAGSMQRSGNRRVTSIHRRVLGLTFAFEHCRDGLQDALHGGNAAGISSTPQIPKLL